MGCVSSTNTRNALQVQCNDEVATLTLSAYEADFRRSVETRFPALRGRKWTYVDADSGEEIRNQEDFQQLRGSLRGRSAGKVRVMRDVGDRVGTERGCSKAVCGVWSGDSLVGSGVYVGGQLVLLPSKLRKTATSCAFRQDKSEVKIPIKPDFAQDLQACGLSLLQLNISFPAQTNLLKTIPPCSLRVSSQQPISGKAVTCLHYLRSISGLRSTPSHITDVTKDRITIAERLEMGSEGAPLVYDNQDTAGFLIPLKADDLCTFVRTEVVLGDIQKCKGVREIESAFSMRSSSVEEVEIGNMDDVPQDEGKATIGFLGTEIAPRREKVQASQQEASEQFQFDEMDLPPQPASLPLYTSSLPVTPFAHFISPVRGGSELWKLGKSAFSLTKQMTDIVLSPNCNFVDTPLGVLVTGGDDISSRKCWVWTSEGLRELLQLEYPHAKHCSIYLANAVFVISGDSTDRMESIDVGKIATSEAPKLPKKRFHAAVCNVGQSAFFLAGGYVGPQAKPSRSLLEFRVSTQSWLKVSFSLSTPMAGLAIHFIHPKSLIVLGGKNSQGAASAEAYIIDVQSGLRVASLYLPEPATFTRTHPVRDEDSFLTFSDQTHQFEFDIKRQRFYLLAVSTEGNKA